MSTVSIRDLANNASAVVEEVATSGRPAVVTKHGKPVAALVPIDQEALEDWVLANAPEFVANMAEADEEIVKGVRGKPRRGPRRARPVITVGSARPIR